MEVKVNNHKEQKEKGKKEGFRHVGFSAKKEHVPDFYD